MACFLIGASHHLNQYWIIVNWTPWNKSEWNLNQFVNIFIGKNQHENVICIMWVILSRSQCVNTVWHLWCVSKTVRNKIALDLLLRHVAPMNIAIRERQKIGPGSQHSSLLTRLYHFLISVLINVNISRSYISFLWDWLSLQCFLPWINHFSPQCGSWAHFTNIF